MYKYIVIILTLISCSSTMKNNLNDVPAISEMDTEKGYYFGDKFYISPEMYRELDCYYPPYEEVIHNKFFFKSMMSKCVLDKVFVGDSLAIQMTADYMDYLGSYRVCEMKNKGYRGEILFEKLIELGSTLTYQKREYVDAANTCVIGMMADMIANIDGRSARDFIKDLGTGDFSMDDKEFFAKIVVYQATTINNYYQQDNVVLKEFGGK